MIRYPPLAKLAWDWDIKDLPETGDNWCPFQMPASAAPFNTFAASTSTCNSCLANIPWAKCAAWGLTGIAWTPSADHQPFSNLKRLAFCHFEKLLHLLLPALDIQLMSQSACILHQSNRKFPPQIGTRMDIPTKNSLLPSCMHASWVVFRVVWTVSMPFAAPVLVATGSMTWICDFDKGPTLIANPCTVLHLPFGHSRSCLACSQQEANKGKQLVSILQLSTQFVPRVGCQACQVSLSCLPVA